MERRGIVGMIGGNRQPPAVLADAEAIGRAIAQAGAILLTGGEPTAKPDVKDAAMRGASAAQPPAVARLISILPFAGSSRAVSPHHLVLDTHLTSYERDPINGLTPDNLIVLCGAAGTLCELAFAAVAAKPICYVRSLAFLREQRRADAARLCAAIDEALAKYPNVFGGAALTRASVLAQLDAELRRARDEQGDAAGVAAAAAATTPQRTSAPTGFPGIPMGDRSSMDRFEEQVRTISR